MQRDKWATDREKELATERRKIDETTKRRKKRGRSAQKD
jgi:hypothetical protein